MAQSLHPASHATRMLKGWNGNLTISDEGLTITRGLKGWMTKNHSIQRLEIPYAAIRRVRFMPATNLAGFLQLLTADEPPPQYRQETLSDPQAVTFTKRRSSEWESVAMEIADRTRLGLERLTPPDYWTTIHEMSPKLPRGFAFGRIKVESATPIDWTAAENDDPASEGRRLSP